MSVTRQDRNTRPRWIKATAIVGSCVLVILLVWCVVAAVHKRQSDRDLKQLNFDLTNYDDLKSFTKLAMHSNRYSTGKVDNGFRHLVDLLETLTPQQVGKIGQSGGLSFVDLAPKQQEILIDLTRASKTYEDNIGWYRSTDLRQSRIRIRDKRQFEWHIKKKPEDTSPGEAVYITTLYSTD